ncbi:MAG: signal peptidase I [Cytophagales bacterium]|nr:signal peptidase I [Bernardetiaceae bacterium]MDW8211363.1 signal peptidase I [Cytophagales bacterium]
MPRQTPLRTWLAQIGAAFVLAWIIDLFVAEIVFLRDETMWPSLVKGDLIIISKLHYGPRTPATLLKIPLTEPFIGKNLPTFIEKPQLPVIRLWGLDAIRRGDVICFNHPRKPEHLPADLRNKLISRCVGLPGDSVRIHFFNLAHYQEDTVQRSYLYLCWVGQKNYQAKECLQQAGAHIYTLHSPYKLIATPEQIKQLVQLCKPDSVTKAVTPKGRESETTFPFSPLFDWNKSFLGPLWVPRKGVTIPMNDSTIALYDWLMEYEQGEKIQFSGNAYSSKQVRRKAFLNSQPIDHYTFQENYYFVLNDNRSRSDADSRIFGLVPERLIIGKAWRVLACVNNGIEPDRFFLRVQ